MAKASRRKTHQRDASGSRNFLAQATPSKSKSEQRLAVKAGSKVQSISCASPHVRKHLGNTAAALVTPSPFYERRRESYKQDQIIGS